MAGCGPGAMAAIEDTVWRGSIRRTLHLVRDRGSDAGLARDSADGHRAVGAAGGWLAGDAEGARLRPAGLLLFCSAVDYDRLGRFVPGEFWPHGGPVMMTRLLFARSVRVAGQMIGVCLYGR